MDPVRSLVETLVQVTKNEFNHSAAVPAVRSVLGINSNEYRNFPSNGLYNELHPNQSDAVSRYKILAVAFAVTTSSNNGYNYGQQFIRQDMQPSLKDRMEAEAQRLAVPMYRNYLEQGLREHNHQFDFLSLFNDLDFCQKFASYVTEEDFINDQLYAVYLTGNKAYPQAIAYLYERLRSKLPVDAIKQPMSFGRSFEMGGLLSLPSLAQPVAPLFAYWKEASKVRIHLANNPAAHSEFQELSLPLRWSVESSLQPPSFPALGTAFNNVFLQSPELRILGSEVTSKVTTSSSQPLGLGDFPPPPIITTTYGGDVVAWMNSLAFGGYGDVFIIGLPHSTDQVSPPFGGGCFIPGTLVHTEDDDIPIEEISTGTKVLAKAPGQFGIVSHEQVKWPVNDQVWLYGLNDDEPFFTPGHVFLTKAGLKAVNPALALQENPDLHVQQLSVGDVVFRLQGLSYEEISITKFKSGRAACSHVYGLHFRKGAKGGCSYHANGYLVAANYPEVTLQRLQDNFAHLSHKEQQEFGSMVKALPKSLKSVFGPALVQSFESTFATPASSLTSQFLETKARLVKKMEQRHLHGRQLVRTFPLTNWTNFCTQDASLHSHHPEYKSHVAAINGDRSLPEVAISHGAVLVDGQLAKHARVDAKEIHWSRPLSSGEWEHGLLKTSPDGMFTHGAIGHGPGPTVDDAALPQLAALTNTVHVMAASHSNDYKLISSIDQFVDTATAGAVTYPGSYVWQRWYKLETSLSVTPGGLAQIQVTLPELDMSWNNTTDPLYSTTSYVDTDKWTLNATVTVISGMEPFLIDVLTPTNWKWDDTTATSSQLPPPAAFSTINLVVNLATNVASGSWTELVKTGADASATYSVGAVHAIYCQYSTRAAALRTHALAAVAANDHQVDGAPLALTAHMHSSSASIHHEPSPVTAHLTQVFATSTDLPLTTLQTLSTPADVDLHTQSQNYMIAAAGYWRGDDEKGLFGDEKDAIGQHLPDSLKTSLPESQQKFLRDIFSKALLSYGLSRNKDYSTKFDDSRKDKMEFWWTGKMEKCLSHYQEYNAITSVTARLAFRDLIVKENFNPYYNSTVDYAEKFFQAVTDDAILNNLATSIVMGNQNLVNRYCAILNALDKRNRKYDSQLWTLVRDKQFVRLAASSPTFGNDVSEFLKQYMIDLQNRITNKDPSISDAMRNEMKTDIDTLKSTLDAKDAADLAFKIFDSTTDLGLNILAVIDEFKRRPMVNGQSNMPRFLTRLGERLGNWVGPKIKNFLKIGWTAFKGILMVGMQAAALYFSIGYLMKWNDLNPAQRAVAVATTLEAVLRGLYEMVETYKELRGLAPDSLGFKLRCVRWNRASKDKVTSHEADPNNDNLLNEDNLSRVERISEDGELDPLIPHRSTAQQIANEGATTEVDASANIAREFSLASAVVEGVMIGVNIATAVLLGMELRDEWDHVPDNIRAMDTINLMITCAQAITGAIAVGAMVIGAELAVIPFVGALVCLAGLIMMIVETFVPRPKPDPVQDYLNDHGYNFVDGLNSSPTPQLSYSATKSVTGNSVTLSFTIKQPANLVPTPMVKQFIVKAFAGTTAGDLFLPPTVTAGKVTANDITWSIDEDSANFKVDGNNNPDPSDHSVLGMVYPITKATYDAKDSTKTIHGTSIIGTNTLKFSVKGTLNPAFKAMEAQITEILVNPPEGIASTDVKWKTLISSGAFWFGGAA